MANCIQVKPDHPLVVFCNELVPNIREFSWLVELFPDDKGFVLRAALPRNLHFGELRANLASKTLTYSDYDAHGGDERIVATKLLTPQQIDELNGLLQAAINSEYQ